MGLISESRRGGGNETAIRSHKKLCQMAVDIRSKLWCRPRCGKNKNVADLRQLPVLKLWVKRGLKGINSFLGRRVIGQNKECAAAPKTGDIKLDDFSGTPR